MRQSQLLGKTLREPAKETEVISHQLLLRGGFITQLASGIYNFLPLGLRAHQRVADIIREEMNAIGSQEVFLASLQPKELWVQTNRWDHMDPPLFRVKDRHSKEFALGSTHEEVITDLVRSQAQSYRDLPRALYQIQTKFRNEMRFNGGLLRTREFLMKDLYSFHPTVADLEQFFQKVLSAYDKIFHRCGVQALRSEASGGVFTKEKTYEFQVIAEVGEDKIVFCPKCNWAANLEVCDLKKGALCPQCGNTLDEASTIEVGHTFRLGTKYAEAMNLYFLDEKGDKQAVVMGCYGIGIGRLMATIVEVNHDKKGIVWPKEVTPFHVHLIQIEDTEPVRKATEKVYSELSAATFGGNGQSVKIEVLYDDRTDRSAGEKFADADLIGISYRVVISERTLEKQSAEVKRRGVADTQLIKLIELPQFMKKDYGQ